jgi:electron transfer flavoprotein beta subunit
MKILVCISKAPDTTSRIAFTDGNTQFDENGVQFIVNPYDEWYALVRALEIKEAGGGQVTTITVGGADCDPIIRKALAIGADNAVRVEGEGDAMFVAKQIAEYAKANGFDAVFAGKESIQFNSGAVGGMVAEYLDWPYISLATKLEMEGGTAVITRDVQGGSEVLGVDGPFVLSAAKGMAEQRIPNMRGIMAARSKPLEVIPAADAASHTSIASYALPPAKGDCRMIDAENPAELFDLLRNEAKVL